MKVNRPISQTLTIKLVAMATSLNQSEKEGPMKIYEQIPTNGEKSVKIGPVDPEIMRSEFYHKK